MSAEERTRELGLPISPGTSPAANHVNAVRTGNPRFISGKAPLPDGLARQPALRFRLRAAYVGVASVVLHYDRHDGRAGAEHFEFGADGRVVRASAHYVDEGG